MTLNEAALTGGCVAMRATGDQRPTGFGGQGDLAFENAISRENARLRPEDLLGLTGLGDVEDHRLALAEVTRGDGRFIDALGLRLCEDGRGFPILRGGRCQWILDAPLCYQVGGREAGERIVVPAGSLTDLASVPRLFWSLTPPDGPWVKAAIVHDHLYATRGLHGRYDRAASDAIFHQAMGVVGVPTLSRSVIWLAVRIGGGIGWGR